MNKEQLALVSLMLKGLTSSLSQAEQATVAVSQAQVESLFKATMLSAKTEEAKAAVLIGWCLAGLSLAPEVETLMG